LNTTAYIVINLLLFSSWYLFLFRKKEFLSFTDRLIGTFILALTQIIATEMLLGILFKRLYALPLFLLNLSIFVSILSFWVFTAGDTDSRSKVHYIKAVFYELKDKIAELLKIIKKDLVLACILCLFILSIIWMIFLGYLFPSYTWDALWYHLPIVGYIMQSGAIREVSNNSFIDQFINIFPKNIELFFLWNVIFLKSDVITDLSQLLFTIVGVLAVYGLALKLRINKKYALYSSLLFFFTPIMILQSTTNYVDVAISVLFLIAVNLLIDSDYKIQGDTETVTFNIRRRKLLIFIAGLCTGILLGAKGSGPLFVVVLSVVVLIQEFIRHSYTNSKKIKILLKSFNFYVLYFFLPVLLMGGYWYIKNWVVYGNPVYPIEISFLNVTIFKGLYQGIIEPAPEIIKKLSFFTRPLYVWTENIKYYLYDSRLGGLGPLWFILFLPSILFSFIYSVVKRKYDFIIVSVIITMVFLVYPRNWNPRYVIFIVGLGALSFGIALDYFSNKGSIPKIIALVLTVYTFGTANSPCVTPKKIKEFLHRPTEDRTIGWHAPFNIDLHARQEYGYWIWISRNITEGDILAYTFEPLFLSPLWNKAFSNKIVYIKSKTYKEWLKNLNKNNVMYILVKNMSQEDKWIRKEMGLFSSLAWTGIKEKFKVEYSDENYRIIKFLGSG
jgi:hypothetical protein